MLLPAGYENLKYKAAGNFIDTPLFGQDFYVTHGIWSRVFVDVKLHEMLITFLIEDFGYLLSFWAILFISILLAMYMRFRKVAELTNRSSSAHIASDSHLEQSDQVASTPQTQFWNIFEEKHIVHIANLMTFAFVLSLFSALFQTSMIKEDTFTLKTLADWRQKPDIKPYFRANAKIEVLVKKPITDDEIFFARLVNFKYGYEKCLLSLEKLYKHAITEKISNIPTFAYIQSEIAYKAFNRAQLVLEAGFTMYQSRHIVTSSILTFIGNFRVNPEAERVITFM